MLPTHPRCGRYVNENDDLIEGDIEIEVAGTPWFISIYRCPYCLGNPPFLVGVPEIHREVDPEAPTGNNTTPD